VSARRDSARGTARDTARDTLDVGLRLLDHQIASQKDELLGNVDNLVLQPIDDTLTITALVTGPTGLGPRIGGRLGGWMQSIWRRLRTEGDPAPVVIEMRHVLDIAAAVTIDEHAAQLVADGAQLERWLRYYLISRIPGARGGPDRLAGEPIGPVDPAGNPQAVRLGAHTHLLSDLLGAAVHGPDGADLGFVRDVCSSAPPQRQAVGNLRLEALIVGRRQLGAQMGYATQPDQGPWLVAAPMRAWHRADRIVPVQDVDRVDWAERRVSLRTLQRARHPHER
jgi:sporulation protein YlmC with PRC-barrel domain